MTAIDTNLLIDILGETSVFTPDSVAALDAARGKGGLIISPVVAAEIAAYFTMPDQLGRTLSAMEIRVVDFTLEALHGAGRAFVRYRRRSAKPKDRMLADFLVGAHALAQADALLTRDRGYFRTYFPKLRVVRPERGK